MTGGAHGNGAPRRDAQATRQALIAAAGSLIGRYGGSFGLSDLAREAGVSTATVYRHFDDVPQVLREYQAQLVDELATALRGVPRDQAPLDRLDEMARRWVQRVDKWGRPAARLRSPLGVLERVRAGDPPMTQLDRTLSAVIRELIEDGEIPRQPVDIAVLLWLAIFDERLVLELRTELRIPGPEVASTLTRALLGALGYRDG